MTITGEPRDMCTIQPGERKALRTLVDEAEAKGLDVKAARAVLDRLDREIKGPGSF